MNTTQDRLREKVWESQAYYDRAQRASEGSHPSLQLIKELCKSRNVLEVGCGEGTKLTSLGAKKTYGTDLSFTGLSKAVGKNIFCVQANSERLPFASNNFDCCVSMFTLEHLTDPAAVIDEMIRVTKRLGNIIFLAPNFGAPNRCSPCFVGSRARKLVKGFIKDFWSDSGENLGWNYVEPRAVTEEYQVDYDTTVEPYIGTLAAYLKRRGVRVLRRSSNWQVKMNDEPMHQKVFKFLADIGVYPFVYWGPHLFLVGEKR